MESFSQFVPFVIDISGLSIRSAVVDGPIRQVLLVILASHYSTVPANGPAKNAKMLLAHKTYFLGGRLRTPILAQDRLEGRPDDPLAGKPDDPLAGRPDDPLAGKPDDPLAGKPDDPLEGKPDDPLEGKPDNCVGKPESLDPLCEILASLVSGLSLP